jgi:hypothetical protein
VSPQPCAATPSGRPPGTSPPCARTSRNAPLDERLSALAALHRALGHLHQCAQREAITTAGQQGWPLRRTAAALNCSHEQVRLVIAAGDPRGAAR